MRNGGVISGVRVAHDRATVDEIASASTDDVRSAVESLLARDGVSEAFALQTCNRAEAYVVTDAQAVGRRALDDFAPDVRDAAVVDTNHEQSLRHLMRVAAGLESLVLGEDQILGQLKRAFEEARSVGGIGRMLDDAVTKAIHVGERARTETAINEGAVSLGSAAVRLAESETAVAGQTALVVGAGEMGTLAAKSLAAAGVDELLVANRTVPHAEHVAAEIEESTPELSARAVPLAAVSDAVADASVVVSATGSPDYVLSPAHLDTGSETTLIDLAQPRDVDPAVAEVPGVSLHDIDGLESVTEETRARRREAADRVESMIDDEFERLLDAFKRKRADRAISGMYEAAERVKQREVDTALSKLDAQGELTDEQRETVSALADALVGQLLSAPTKSLREAAVEDDWDTIQTAMTLFDPDFGGADASTDAPSGPREGMPENLPDEIPEDADVPRHVVESLADD